MRHVPGAATRETESAHFMDKPRASRIVFRVSLAADFSVMVVRGMCLLIRRSLNFRSNVRPTVTR
jgi:hypothetical protein